MKPIARLLAGLAVIVALFVASERDAHALGPIDLEAGLKVGVATKPSDFTNTPYGFGLGARAGIGIFNLYLGASVIHYFGSSVDESTSAGSVSGHLSSNLIGGEIGYTIGAIPLIQIRPQVGFGDAIFMSSATLGNVEASDSKGYFYLEPGATVLVPLGLLYVGADANVLILPSVDVGTDSKTETGFSFHAQVGVRL